jgi:surfeit locus 1 family protein
MTLMTRRLIVWGAAVLVSLLTGAAGVWQWGRAHAKQALLDAHERAEQEAAWGNADWPCQADAAALPSERRAVLRGRWRQDRTVYLDNRPMQGKVGFIVVTPLQLSEPSGRCAAAGAVVLVERGWVPRNAADRRHVPALPDEGPVSVTVSGRVLPHVSRVFALGQEAMPDLVRRRASGPVIRQNAGAAFWQQWLGTRPMPGGLREEGVDGRTTEPEVALSRHWDVAVTLSPSRHLAYAAQWFALSALAVGLTVWFQLIRPHLARAQMLRAQLEGGPHAPS